MTDFETVPVGTTKEMERVKQERDALAAHVERLLFAVRYSAEYLNAGKLNSVGSGSKAHQELNTALSSTPNTSLVRRDLIKQAEVLESLASDCAGNRDVYERCMARAADLRIQQQGDEVENNEQFT